MTDTGIKERHCAKFVKIIILQLFTVGKKSFVKHDKRLIKPINSPSEDISSCFIYLLQKRLFLQSAFSIPTDE